MQIEELDPADDAGLAAFHEHEVRVAATQPYGTAWTLPELTVAARTDDPWTARALLWAHLDDGEVVATGQLEVPLRDNLETAWVALATAPEHRGSVGPFIEHLKDRVRLLGRRRLECSAKWPPGDDEGPDAALLRAHGFRLGLIEAQRVLDLPPDRDELAGLAEKAAAHHAGYELRTWRGPVPDDLVVPYAAMRSVMAVEAPAGDMGWEAEDFPPERVRQEEAELAAQGRVLWTTVAVAPDGVLAGHSQIVVPGSDPVNAYQWDTLVLPEHRGHRLGLAMKVRNLLAAADDLAPRELLHTWNAADNAPMIAVNEAMGFRLASMTGEFRCDL
ncbi:GNAT family N-acetyltransferase [Mumia sp. zg.B17]|uniref:GNAT family N-acetyltransferase n=1 Tax=Mumia sp. zg.B17 TaxID=2855446 RepID=UPI001C6E8B1D|nr:GNAT family N-acetyltransferase [Mumia sp. zg.B17]MBW9204721.1 GNAT family N-acetyltransferase [Mumia sp. zg.B17]